MLHVAQLSSTFDVVRLRLPVQATLADDRTKGDFITALHNFYLRWPDHVRIARRLYTRGQGNLLGVGMRL